MEITKDKVTELFCIIDEFYKVFDAENAGKLLFLKKKKDYGNKTISFGHTDFRTNSRRRQTVSIGKNSHEGTSLRAAA